MGKPWDSISQVTDSGGTSNRKQHHVIITNGDTHANIVGTPSYFDKYSFRGLGVGDRIQVETAEEAVTYSITGEEADGGFIITAVPGAIPGGGSFLSIVNNLADLGSAAAARANLSVYSAAEIDTLVAALAASALAAANNLSDLNNAVDARDNLSVYSIAQVDAAIASFVSGAYKGTWDANTNTPTINSGAGTAGDYYIVGTAGTTPIDGIASWAVGDQIRFSGSVWEKVELFAGGLDTDQVTEGTVNLYMTAAEKTVVANVVEGQIENPFFNEYANASGNPDDWDATGAVGGTRTRATGKVGAYALQMEGPAGGNAWIRQQRSCAEVPHFVEATTELDGGTYDGASILLAYLDGGGGTLGQQQYDLAIRADAAGDISNTKSGERKWRFDKFDAPAGTEQLRIFAMSHWNVASGGFAIANQITWHECNAKPATYAALVAARAHDIADEFESLKTGLEGLTDYKMRIPSGTTTQSLAPGVTMQVAPDAIVEGDVLDATIDLTDDGVGVIEYFALQGAATFRDFTLQHTVTNTGVTAQTFRPQSDFRLINMNIDGGVSESGGAVSHVGHVIDLDGTVSDRIWSAFNYYRNTGRIVLKSNANANTHRHIKFIGDVIENAYVEPIALNSPGGILRDAAFLCVSVRDTLAHTVGLEGAGLGSSSGEDIRWLGCNHHGTGDELIHMEEGITRFTAVGNTGFYTNASSGIFITDNNASGESKTPSFGAILANVFVRETRGSGPIGIQLVDDSSGSAPLHDSVILGNIASGWDQAARTGENHGRNLMAFNIFDDANQGLRMRRPTLMTRFNLFKDNDQAIQLDSGGAIGPQFFIQTAAWDGTAVYLSQPIDPGAHKGTIIDWAVDIEDFTIVNGTRDYLIMPLGEFLSGDMFVVLYQGTTAHRLAHYRPTWDGTVFTPNLVGAIKGVGSVALVDIRNNGAGNLAVRLNNTFGSSLAGARLQIEFRGAHQFA